MLKVGLTGGIASGKSYVLGLLRELGCQVLDADAVAHRVMEPGEPAYTAIVDHFGPGILDGEGRIDRTRLGAIVFADPGERAALNAIVHPRVYEAQAVWLEGVAAGNVNRPGGLSAPGVPPGVIAVIDAALMIETGSYRRFDCVVVVHCRPELQLQRLMERNRISREAAEARIAAQMPTAEKLCYADFTIDTSEGFAETRRQVEDLYHQLILKAEKM
jgi:dephospho-CoA kinase